MLAMPSAATVLRRRARRLTDRHGFRNAIIGGIDHAIEVGIGSAASSRRDSSGSIS
jgi:hypothetical protein